MKITQLLGTAAFALATMSVAPAFATSHMESDKAMSADHKTMTAAEHKAMAADHTKMAKTSTGATKKMHMKKAAEHKKMADAAPTT